MNSPVAASTQTESSHWKLAAAVIIGVSAVVAVLAITFVLDPKNTFQQNVAWAVLALGIAGVASIIPGALNVNIPKTANAGGALAIFVLVYTQSPLGGAIVDKIIPPKADSRAIAEAYMKLVDSEDYAAAYQASSDWTRSRYSQAEWVNIFETQRKPVGKPIARELRGISAADNMPGAPAGTYKGFQYWTRLSTNPDYTWIEWIILGSEVGEWRVFSYTINPMPGVPPPPSPPPR